MPVPTFTLTGDLSTYTLSEKASGYGNLVVRAIQMSMSIPDQAKVLVQPDPEPIAIDGTVMLTLAAIPGVKYQVSTSPLVLFKSFVFDAQADGATVDLSELLPVSAASPSTPYLVGQRGQSAYEVAVADGFAGTEAEWLTSLEGPTGPTGPAGTTVYGELTGIPSTFAPSAHKSSHATGGADPLTPGDIGAATATQGAKADSATQPAQIRGNRFVALGDSISTAADLAAGGAGLGSAWPHMLCALTMQRLNFGGNAGVAGNNTAQILARVPDAIALAPAIVTVLGGTNDLTQSVTFATWSANIKSIAAQLRAAGIRVVLCTIPPRGNTTYLTTQTTWNTWLRQFAADNRYDLLDFYTLLADPVTGMYKSGYDSGDALHPSQAAHIVMAQYASQQLTTSAFSPIAARSAIDTANLVANPLLSAGSPTPTSWVANGVASADFTEGLVTDSDFDGKAWEVAYTAAASSANFREFASFNITTGWAVGDTVLLCCRAKVVSSSGVTPSAVAGLRFRILFNGGTPSSYTPVAASSTTHATGLHWFTATIPTGTTSLKISAVLGTLTVGGSFTARVGNFGIYNLSTLASTAP